MKWTYSESLRFSQVGWGIRRFETMKGGPESDTLPLRGTKPSLEAFHDHDPRTTVYRFWRPLAPGFRSRLVRVEAGLPHRPRPAAATADHSRPRPGGRPT